MCDIIEAAEYVRLAESLATPDFPESFWDIGKPMARYQMQRATDRRGADWINGRAESDGLTVPLADAPASPIIGVGHEL